MLQMEQLARVFVELSDTLIDDFDLVDFLSLVSDHTAAVLGPAEVGILFADADGRLQAMASSTHRLRILELFELQNNQGPCLDCIRTGAAFTNHDLNGDATPWPEFDAAARDLGFSWAHAFPMRLRNETIGAVNVLSPASTGLTQAQLDVGQAIADIASIGLLQQRGLRESHVLNEQLQTALNTRVIIEQAKGVIAERMKVEVDEAFRRMRTYARTKSVLLRDVAEGVVDGTVDSADLAPKPAAPVI